MRSGRPSSGATKRRQRGAAAHRLGLWAERGASLLLCLKGYRILDQRVQTPLGEIDIVAARGRTLVVVEVKARPHLLAAQEAVSMRQQQRLSAAARAYLSRHPEYAEYMLRFDVLAFVPWRWPQHIVNAFNPIFIHL